MDANIALGAAVVAGFASKGSVPSLIAGSVTGLGLIACGRTKNFKVAAAISAILTLMMGIRFAKTKKVMPAGMVALLSSGGLVFNLLKMKQ
eukprot:Skav207290  [mRNA]  locus=scaffold434:259739:261191:- [translate_table: standard]